MSFFDELRNDIAKEELTEPVTASENSEEDLLPSQAVDNVPSEADEYAIEKETDNHQMGIDESDDTNLIKKITYFISYFTACFCIGFLVFSYVSERNSYKNLDAMRLALENERARLKIENTSLNNPNGKNHESIDRASIHDILGTAELVTPAELEELERLEIDPKERRKREKELISPLAEYEYFYGQNDDFAGWIDVTGTTINYPIMQGMDNEYYLTHGFEKKKDKFGMLTLDFRCPLIGETPEYIVYGHNVRDGKMFGELLNFKAKGYYEYHPTINFNTVVSRDVYRIFAVIVTTVNPGSVPVYECMAVNDSQEYSDFVKDMKSQSLYDIDYQPEEMQPILALVTCEKTTDTGRFVVLAAKE